MVLEARRRQVLSAPHFSGSWKRPGSAGAPPTGVTPSRTPGCAPPPGGDPTGTAPPFRTSRLPPGLPPPDHP